MNTCTTISRAIARRIFWKWIGNLTCRSKIINSHVEPVADFWILNSFWSPTSLFVIPRESSPVYVIFMRRLQYVKIIVNKPELPLDRRCGSRFLLAPFPLRILSEPAGSFSLLMQIWIAPNEGRLKEPITRCNALLSTRPSPSTQRVLARQFRD